jgi:putative acetyltransferase
VAARIPEDLPTVRALFQAYADSLGFDLDFQGFRQEIAHLPGEYAKPSGAILVAHSGEHFSGCIALRKLTEEMCEMKRLYVQPRYRAEGLGRRLAEAIIAEARHSRYRFMRLDTVPTMAAAISLYESLGFRRIAPYRYNPVAGALFMELAL